MQVLTLENPAFTAPPGKRLAVLGDPIGHSLSPAMHNAALRAMSREHPELREWAYDAVQVPADDLEQTLDRLYREGVYGINLTIPHKVRALEAVHAVDEAARPMGAVNTLVQTPLGYRGTNTDGYGILKALEESFDCEPAGRDVWLFGAGGAARGILVACLQAGCARLSVVNRSEGRLEALRDQVLRANIEGISRTRFFTTRSSPADVRPGALLVNATSLGLKADDPCPIERPYLGNDASVYDTTYGTANQLARAAREAGLPYADGLSMLVWQGVRSLEIWTGHPVPAAVMRAAAEQHLNARDSHG